MIAAIASFINLLPILLQLDNFDYLPKHRSGQPTRYNEFTILYNRQHKQADWVAYELTAEELKASVPVRDYFSIDTGIRSGTANRLDYKYQRYDRGHLCRPDYCTSSKESYRQAFLFSNISPQSRLISNNKGMWTKLERLEMLYAQKLGKIYAVSGPVFKDNQGQIGRNKVTVPGYYFKAILSGNLDEGIGFLIKNGSNPSEPYESARKLSQLEKETGIDFFHKLPNNVEREVENSLDINFWKRLSDPNFIPDTEEVEVVAPPSTIKIASFNIQIFGKSKSNKPEVMDTLATIIRNYDIVSVQEIKDVSGETPVKFLSKINETDSSYAMVLSPRSGVQPDNKNYQEQYAYYYNFNTITSLDSGRLYDDSTDDDFRREPFLAQFKAKEGDFSFVLSSIHTRPNEAVEEIDALHDVVIWAKTQYQNEEDIITLGDFNASCNYASTAQLDELELRTDAYFWIVPDDADTNVSTSTDCAYDRIVITNSTLANYALQWGIDRSFSSKSVSDHYPVWAEFFVESNSQN